MPADGGLTKELQVGFTAERFCRAGVDFPFPFAKLEVLTICRFDRVDVDPVANIARSACSSTVVGALSNEERVEEELLKDGLGGGKNDMLEEGTRSTVSVRREREPVEFGGLSVGLYDGAREFQLRE